MSTVTRRSDYLLRYPPNLQMLELANLVAMYRDRGAAVKAKPGEYLACCITGKLLKEAKYWFGLFYSQQAWDSLLTKNSKGYPLTEIELNVLGMIAQPPDVPDLKSFIESHLHVPNQIAYLIMQDLKKFEFFEEEDGVYSITTSGQKALDGIARRIFEINFIPEMLFIAEEEQFEEWYDIGKDTSTEQTTLF